MYRLHREGREHLLFEWNQDRVYYQDRVYPLMAKADTRNWARLSVNKKTPADETTRCNCDATLTSV